jgi:DNA-binding NarL/FixJ family response regulator
MKSMNSDKIMVVEDEWIVAKEICMDLKDLGYKVCSTASTGDEAIRNVEEDRPDLILMDIVLKGKMDGIEAAERITSQFDIPIIYLTAYTNQEYIERAKQTKPFAYLVKPFRQKELYANIEMVLHKHRLDKEIKEYLGRLAKCYRGKIESVSGAIELRGPYVSGHHRRVAEFVNAIAGEMKKYRMTPRQQEIALLVATGQSNREIAEKLSITEYTVKDHVKKIFQIFDIKNRSELFPKMLNLM